MTIPGNMLSAVTESVDPNTSGWTALLNCTLALGSGGRNGDGVLAVKSVAAGEMRARTVSSYPVVEGVVYQTFADTAGAEVERIGIRWMSDAGVEVSITWSLYTAAPSTGWHRVGVAGAAPAGTARAQVVVSSSPAGVGVAHFWENVYLGLPIRKMGNLLSFEAASFEVDTSAWMVEANATLSRQVPLAGWAVDFYTVGGHVLALTATANGAASARTVERSPVTPGTDYQMSAYLSPPLASSATWIELRFYDAAGSQLLASRGTLAAPGTGFCLQIASGVAPLTAATCGVAVGITGATAGQVMRVEGVSVVVATPLAAGSVLPLEDASFEQGVGSWTRTSGVAVLARSTPWGAHQRDGSYALTITSSTATVSVLLSGKYALAGGTTTDGQAWSSSYLITVGSGGWSLASGVAWYDASGSLISTDMSPSEPIPSTNWWVLTASSVAPPGATSAAIQIVATATAATSVLYLDKVALREALPLTDSSVSSGTASATVIYRDVTGGETYTLWRVAQDGQRTLVRGPDGLLSGVSFTSDQVVIEDYEAPLGVPFHYYLEGRNAAGGLTRFAEWDDIIIPHDDINLAWIKDPGNPQRNLMVMVEKAPDWQRPIEQADYVVKNRRNKVVLSGRRQGLEGDLAVWTRSDTERAALHWILDSGNTLLWQAAPGMGVSDMYVSVGQATEGRTGGTAREPWRAWTLPLIQEDMPVTTGVNGSAGRTWQDILSGFATWQDVWNTYATWEDLLLDKRMG